MTGAEKSKQSDYDQINSNDIIQKLWYDKNDNTGNKRQHWTNANVQIHEFILSS
jgi:hypothetical protein